MLYLLFTVASSIAIAALLRLSEERDGNRFVVAGVNYVVATALSLLLPRAEAGPVVGTSPDLPALMFPVLVGIGFVVGFIVTMPAMRLTGMAVPATTSRLSTLIPVSGAMVVFGEQPTMPQIAGIAVGLCAFVLLGIAQRRTSEPKRNAGSLAVWLLAGVFLISGVVDFSMKIAQTQGAASGPFLTIVFATAGIGSFTGALIRRRRPSWRDFTIGAALGVPNFFASYCILRALGSLPAIVVFPVMNAAVVLGVTLAAMFLWREIPRPLTSAGLALAAVAVLLLGIG